MMIDCATLFFSLFFFAFLAETAYVISTRKPFIKSNNVLSLDDTVQYNSSPHSKWLQDLKIIVQVKEIMKDQVFEKMCVS